jgi:multicomponent Na+:H+ antiporter subunit D
MTVDALLRLVAVTNPGFLIMAAGVLVFFARGTPARALFLVGGPVLALFALIYSAGAGVPLSTVSFGALELVLYQPDSLSMVFGLAFIIAAAIAGVYSLHREDKLQDSTALIYAGAAVGAVFAGDLLTLFIFWELTAIASVFQVLARNTAEGRASAMRYLLFQFASGLLLLTGAAMHLAGTGQIAFAQMADPSAAPPVGVMDINAPGAWLILAAFGIKAGFPLLHNWIQDFYPKATETGAVVLSAFTTKLAVYCLARYFAGLDMLIWIGAIMTVFPVFFAVIENDLRKVLSYSLNNQVGFMVCAVGIGTELAINGAAAHAFAHIMYKSLLFMSMGAVLLRVGTTKASELGGLHRTMPYTTIFCLIGAASIAAMPLFAGFAAKSMIMSSAHGGYGLYLIWLMLLFASAGVMEHSGIKIPYFAFFSHDSGKRPKEAPFNMLLAMGMAAALCIGIGISPRWLYELLPFRDRAIEYLVQDLFTIPHIIEQLQLLAFATLAFLLLKRYGLYPREVPGQIIDIEWTWRKGAPRLVRAMAGPVAAAGRGWSAATTGLSRAAGLLSREAFAPLGWASRRILLTAGAAWTLVVLGAVAAMAMFA